jgi:hypothetical protein
MSTVEQSSIFEPNAGEGIEKKPEPIGRAYYAFSTLLCTPTCLSQDTGRTLGGQADREAPVTVAGSAGTRG